MLAPLPYPLDRPDPAFAVIELFGADNNLHDFLFNDIAEALDGLGQAGSMIAIVDTLGQPAQVLEITQGQTKVLADPGEIDTGDAATLAHLLARALVSYAAAIPLAIGFWDHGTGVTDEDDPNEVLAARRVGGRARGLVPRARSKRGAAPPAVTGRARPGRRLFRLSQRSGPGGVRADRAMLHDDTNGGVLTTREAGSVLDAAFAAAGRDRVAAIFSDTCLNGMIEVVQELGGWADCLIGSADLEPGTGWDYQGLFARLAAPYGAQEWGAAAIAAYADCYADKGEAHPCTLGAFRPDDAVVAAFAGLVQAATQSDTDGFAHLLTARRDATAYDRRDCIDLIEFAELLAASAAPQAMRSEAAKLAAAARGARLGFTGLGQAVARAQGIAFWFPASQGSFVPGWLNYSRLKFDQKTRWSDLLRTRLPT